MLLHVVCNFLLRTQSELRSITLTHTLTHLVFNSRLVSTVFELKAKIKTHTHTHTSLSPDDTPLGALPLLHACLNFCIASLTSLKRNHHPSAARRMSNAQVGARRRRRRRLATSDKPIGRQHHQAYGYVCVCVVFNGMGAQNAAVQANSCAPMSV